MGSLLVAKGGHENHTIDTGPRSVNGIHSLDELVQGVSNECAYFKKGLDTIKDNPEMEMVRHFEDGTHLQRML